jgi:predicted ester cyclase
VPSLGALVRRGHGARMRPVRLRQRAGEGSAGVSLCRVRSLGEASAPAPSRCDERQVWRGASSVWYAFEVPAKATTEGDDCGPFGDNAQHLRADQRGRSRRVRKLVADDYVEHQGGLGFAPTKEGMLEFFRSLLVSFPDFRMDVEDLVASGDKTVARVRATATHQGEFIGVAPTGKGVEVELIDIMRFDAAGLVCEHWGVAYMLTLMQQPGVVPAGPPA